MKTKHIMALGLIGIGTLVAAPAQAGWSIGISLGFPCVAPPVVAYPAPVVVAPPPVAPCPPPVYYVPPPVRVYAPPVVVLPRPMYPPCATFVWGSSGHGSGHGYGHGYGHGRHH